MRFEAALQRLFARCADVGLGEPSARGGNDGSRKLERQSRAWWSENMKEGERSETPRSIAFLRAYLEIAGDGLLSAEGIALDDGFFDMDKSVIKRLERDGYLRWSADGGAHWEITPKGALLLAQSG